MYIMPSEVGDKSDNRISGLTTERSICACAHTYTCTAFIEVFSFDSLDMCNNNTNQLATYIDTHWSSLFNGVIKCQQQQITSSDDRERAVEERKCECGGEKETKRKPEQESAIINTVSRNPFVFVLNYIIDGRIIDSIKYGPMHLDHDTCSKSLWNVATMTVAKCWTQYFLFRQIYSGIIWSIHIHCTQSLTRLSDTRFALWVSLTFSVSLRVSLSKFVDVS